MDDSTKRQLSAIADLLALAEELRVRVWLRGGWAMDFFLGSVTRKHLDIDWFALADDGLRLRDRLIGQGFQDVTTTEPGQQIDLVRDGVDHGIAMLRINDCGEPVVAGGPWAGEPWPVGMLDGTQGRIGDLTAPVIAPAAQIEIKQMTPIWNPRLSRRQKDIDDIAAIRAAMS